MAPPFVIPTSLRNLETPVDNEERLYALEVTSVENLSAHEVDELVRGIAYELAEKEVWCIEEQSIFDQVYSLIRGFSYLEPSARGCLVESLCSNFAVLNPSITALSYASGESSEDAAYMSQQMHSHRNAIKIYSYFLHSILVVEETVEPEPVEKAPSGKRKQAQPRKVHVPAKWNWEVHRLRIVRLLATALQGDLRQLYSMSQPEENLIAFFAKAAFTLLENPTYVKEKDLKDALTNIVAACAAKYGYLVPVTSTILNLLHKYEHLPVPLADLVALAEEKYHSSSLPVAVLREIGHINPEDLKRDNAGADNVSAFLVALAERLPKLMTMNLSIITSHLDGDAYKMRNGVVQVIGTLIIKASKDPSVDAGGDETVRLRTKQGMVDILLERARDSNAYTRSKVLQTWATLCVESAVSIGHWNLVSSVAAGRLEDKGSLVRKSALQLLTTLLQFNPFGPSLRTGPFEATLDQYKEKLREMELASPSTNKEATNPLADIHDDDHINEITAQEAGGNAGMGEGDTLPNTQYEEDDSSQVVHEPDVSNATDFGGLEQTRALVASLESGLQFARCVAGVMDVLKQLLASSSSDDVKHAITLLILARQFEVDGAEESLRKMLPLVFSQEKSIYEAVEGAFTSLYMKRSPSETALNLITLTLDGSIGDLTSIEALVSKFTAKGDISHSTISALWNYFTFNAPDVTPQKSRGALAILCMAAKSQPRVLSSHLQSVMDIGLGRRAKEDPLLARYACIALQRLSDDDRVSLGSGHKVFSILSSLITGPGLPEESWYSAAEQAINAIYVLHPTPEAFASALLIKFSQSVFDRSNMRARGSLLGEESSNSGPAVPEGPERMESDEYQPMASPLSRFLFALAHVALKHLVYVETCVRKVRKQRADKEKAAADVAADLQANAGGSSAQQASNKAKVESINAELGLAASEDARIDVLLERTEKEIISGDESRRFLIGVMAPIVAKICRNSVLMQQYPRLRSSAMLALCKLMAIDADFCEWNLQLLFTVAQNSGEAAVRSNCIIALGDLAFRFPNVLEPWTEHMYARLNDKDQRVRKNSVLVLTHLILNDMVKVKGHISEMVLRLEDEDDRIQNLVKLFFHELSNKGNNPIYNLLPDILSRLSSQRDLSPETFRSVMQFLINAITKDKQKEGLFEKLCHRFSGTTDAKQWRDLSYCLAQLSYTDKSLKKMIELFPKYQNALGVDEVVEHFKTIVAKMKKFSKPDVKALADDFELKILKCHEEKKEHYLALQNAQAHQQRCNERTDSAHSQESGLVDNQDVEQGAEVENTSRAAGRVSEDSELNESRRVDNNENVEGSITEGEGYGASVDHEREGKGRPNGGHIPKLEQQPSSIHTNVESELAEPAWEKSEQLKLANGVSKRTRSVSTSTVLADRVSEGETVGATGSESDIESVSGSDSENELGSSLRNRQSQNGANADQSKPKELLKRVSQTEPDTEEYRSQVVTSTEQYRSQNLSNTEDYRSQRHIDSENYQSQQPPNADNNQSQEPLPQVRTVRTRRSEVGVGSKGRKSVGQLQESQTQKTSNSTKRGLKSSAVRKGPPALQEIDDEQSQEVTQHLTDTEDLNSKLRVTRLVRRQPVESEDDQSQLSEQSTDSGKEVVKPALTRKMRKQGAQSSDDIGTENSSIDTHARSVHSKTSNTMTQKSSQAVARRRR